MSSRRTVANRVPTRACRTLRYIPIYLALFRGGRGDLQGSAPPYRLSTLWAPHAFCLIPIHKYLELSSGGMREERPNPRDDHSSPFRTHTEQEDTPFHPLWGCAYGKVAFKVTGLFTAASFGVEKAILNRVSGRISIVGTLFVG